MSSKQGRRYSSVVQWQYLSVAGLNSGNMMVDDKPVCDDDWGDQEAQVVCRELGFKSGGYATKESYFGSVDLETQAGWDQVRCSGRESSLTECRHESYDDCGNSEGAGVVCHSDEPEKVYNDYGYGYYNSSNMYQCFKM